MPRSRVEPETQRGRLALALIGLENVRADVERATGNDMRTVHCTVCHRNEHVENGLQDGWPKCHGQTMTIDSHETRCL